MNKIAAMGDNNPPGPVEDLKAKHADVLGEIENWLDGIEVESEGQMSAVDDLIKAIKAIEKEAKAEKDSEYRPYKDGCDSVVLKWRAPLEEFASLRTGLLAVVGPFKQKLADEKEAVKRAAYEEASAAEIAAKEAAATADMKDIDARRAADKLAAEATEASRSAQAARDDKVKGLRKSYVATITDRKACINWIAVNDKPALEAFMDDYVFKKTRTGFSDISGVDVQLERRAF